MLVPVCIVLQLSVYPTSPSVVELDTNKNSFDIPSVAFLRTYFDQCRILFKIRLCDLLKNQSVLKESEFILIYSTLSIHSKVT